MQNATDQSFAQKYRFCCCSLALCVLWFCTQLKWKSGGTSKRSTGSHPDDRLIHTHNTREAGSPEKLQYIRDPDTSFKLGLGSLYFCPFSLWLFKLCCIQVISLSSQNHLIHLHIFLHTLLQNWVTQDPEFSMARFLTLVFLCAQLFSHSESMSSAPLLENRAINTSTMSLQVENRAINTCDCAPATLSSKWAIRDNNG